MLLRICLACQAARMLYRQTTESIWNLFTNGTVWWMNFIISGLVYIFHACIFKFESSLTFIAWTNGKRHLFSHHFVADVTSTSFVNKFAFVRLVLLIIFNPRPRHHTTRPHCIIKSCISIGRFDRRFNSMSLRDPISQETLIFVLSSLIWCYCFHSKKPRVNKPKKNQLGAVAVAGHKAFETASNPVSNKAHPDCSRMWIVRQALYGKFAIDVFTALVVTFICTVCATRSRVKWSCFAVCEKSQCREEASGKVHPKSLRMVLAMLAESETCSVRKVRNSTPNRKHALWSLFVGDNWQWSKAYLMILDTWFLGLHLTRLAWGLTSTIRMNGMWTKTN